LTCYSNLRFLAVCDVTRNWSDYPVGVRIDGLPVKCPGINETENKLIERLFGRKV
jgi:hypothetical protein